MIFESYSAEDTFAFGKKIGEEAQPGQVYTLIGDLGVGKTVFTQGVAAGLGIREAVNSPTFTIVQIYDEGRMPFYHFDVYRIGDVEEMEEIEVEEEDVPRTLWDEQTPTALALIAVVGMLTAAGLLLRKWFSE